MTEKLFYEDSYMKTFTATVISCESFGEIYKAVLDRTAFFPEGGGQYADQGTLEKDVKVLDVQEKEGMIYHHIEKEMEPGTKVTGMIDWEKRFSRMQQHTAEHIVSGLIHQKFGYNNVGFHLADSYCTLDIDGPLTKEELRQIEWEANKAVFANVPVEVLYPTKEQLEDMEYRSKIEIEGQVRIVRIPGYDVCACCAPHVKMTGEIGLIKFTQSQNYKGGVRITMLSGDRAFCDYCRKEERVKEIMASLAAKEELVAEAVEHLKEENAILKQKLYEQQKRLLEIMADHVPVREKAVCYFDGTLEGAAPRELMNLILDRGVTICAVFVGNERDGFRYVIGSHDMDVRDLCKVLNKKFEGRGGGKALMVQGSLKGKKCDIEKEFYKEVEETRK